jgi:hypothetical protein
MPADKPFVLPPLPPRPAYHWLEAQLHLWQQAITRRRAVASSGKRFGYAILNRIVGRFLRSGRKFPLLYRLWYWLGWVILSGVPKGRETSTSIILRRAFQRGVTPVTTYRGDYVAFNLLTALALLWGVYFSFNAVVESAYILLTYQHNKYTNVTITHAYPDRNLPHVFDVHGYTTQSDGTEEQLFFEIGPNFWFQEYIPESVFGKIGDHSVCDIDAYGILRRIPLGFRYLSKDSLYVLNPWIVDVRCRALDNSTNK